MSNAGWRAPSPQPLTHPAKDPGPSGAGVFFYCQRRKFHSLNGTSTLAPAGPARREGLDNAIVMSLDAPHDQIIAVHHLAPPGKSEDRKDIRRGAAFDLGGVLGVISDQAAADLGSVGSTDHHRVAAGENAVDPDHPGGQEALAAMQGRDRPGIDGQDAPG